MPKNKPTDKTRNLYHCVLSSKRMLMIDGDHNRWFDGDKLVLDQRQFEVTEEARQAAINREEECRGPGYWLYDPEAHGWGKLAEIRLPNGNHYRREDPRGKMVCIAGPNQGEEFDDIGVYIEDDHTPERDCAYVNVLGLDYSWYRALQARQKHETDVI